MASLILVRHGESRWNKKGIWTGLTDIPLSQKGFEEARRVGNLLRNVKIDIAFISVLLRTKQTLDEIKEVLGLLSLPTFENAALNERDYGIYTGKNKWEIRKEVGNEQFQKIRRGWNVPIQNGESLKDVYNRVIPYYQKEILRNLIAGKNVLIVAHGNSLRPLVKYLENISDENISKLEIATGEVYIYKLDKQGNIISKNSLKPNNAQN